MSYRPRVTDSGVTATKDTLLTCANCEQQTPETEAAAGGWRYYSDGIELLPFCAPCIKREFSADAQASPRG